MAPKKDHALIVLENGTRKIIPKNALRVRDNKKKWILPDDSILKKRNNSFAFEIDGVQKPVAKLVEIGEPQNLQQRRSNDGKRIPVAKKKSFSPHSQFTKKETANKAIMKKKSASIAAKKLLQHAKEKNMKVADLAYSGLLVSTEDRASKDEASKDGASEDEASEDEASKDEASVDVDHDTTIPNSTYVPNLRTPYAPVMNSHTPPPSTPNSDEEEAMQSMHNLTVDGIQNQSPSVAELLTSTPSKKRKSESFIPKRPALTKELSFQITQSSTADKSPDKFLKYVELIANTLINIVTKVHEIEEKMVTWEQLQEAVKSNRSSQAVSEEPSPRTKKQNQRPLPDDNWEVQAHPGLRMKYSDYTNALLAKTMRKRSNEIMKALWTDEQIPTLCVKRRRRTRRASDLDRARPELTEIDERDYTKMIEICTQMQDIRKIPDRGDEDDVNLHHKSWASDWLKNRRSQLKKAAPCPQ